MDPSSRPRLCQTAMKPELQPAPASDEVEEFDIEDMLIKIEAQCQKLEREWMAARYGVPLC